MFTDKDRTLMAEKGISENSVKQQLERFATGFPFLQIAATATTEQGIATLTEAEEEAYVQAWELYCEGDHQMTKFVPASGAASRMFKNLFAFVEADYDAPATDFEKNYFAHLPQAPYYAVLDAACARRFGAPIADLLAAGRHKDVVRALLEADGLNYGALPKGLLLFHRYEDGARTPVEEHLVEGALYARSDKGEVNIHFTVSPEHRALFEAHVAEVLPRYEARFGVRYNVSFSEQKSYTDTIAATPENEPFRNDDGSLLFRPAGHGALIVNLGEMESDIVFIKTVDNVSPERFNATTIRYKKILAGMLVFAQSQLFNDLQLLESELTMEELREMLARFQKTFCTYDEATNAMSADELRTYLHEKLHRPVRVCGMVRNVGEPGGGPFLAYNPDGSISPQILESSQIDMSDPAKRSLFENGTHFNPVDLVCGLRDAQGRNFNLAEFVDENTGFISEKSKSGRALKALELPGLWNGAMSDWNTIFAEVPLATFNPVKTINDLYREEHQ